jgi:Ca2+-binding EF-hand superfamily protein
MRMFRTAVATLVIAAGPALAQPPFGGPGGGPGGGRMMMGMGGNPDDFFNMLSRGKDVITRDDVDPMFQRMFDRFAERLNITNGRITREQFRQATEQMQQRMREGGMGGPGGGGGADQQDRFIEGRFRQSDRNGDGLLASDEMSDTLKAERDKWDKNKDGYIDLAEFKEYVRERFGGNRGGNDAAATPPASTPPAAETPSGTPMPIPEPPPDVSRPIVYRYGHLPKELPAWFADMDLDTDGQVALNEWFKGAKNLPEFRDVAAEERFPAMLAKFRSIDGNDDGFLTAEEVLRSMKETPYATASNTQTDRGTPSYWSRDRGGNNNMGGRGRGNMERPGGGDRMSDRSGSFGPPGGGNFDRRRGPGGDSGPTNGGPGGNFDRRRGPVGGDRSGGEGKAGPRGEGKAGGPGGRNRAG